MKTLTAHALGPAKARAQWHELKALLASKPALSERADILPFFKRRHDLSLLITYYYPAIRNPDVFAHEFPFGGDFTADLVVGDSATREYLLVEFEDAASGSVFTTSRSKRVWASRLEGAYSQLVDWFWKLEDMRPSQDFRDTFGEGATFHGLIAIGKDLNLSKSEEGRLKWRVEHTRIASKRIEVRSFDQLATDMDFWLTNYRGT